MYNAHPIVSYTVHQTRALILTTEECSIGGIVCNISAAQDFARTELSRLSRKVEHIEFN